MKNITEFDIEKRLIYCLLDSNISPVDTDKIKKIIGSYKIDFFYIYNISLQHEISPLVFSNIKKYAFLSVEPAILELFEKDRKETLLYNTSLYNELINTINLLVRHNISFVLLKGLVLSQRLYADFGIRGSIDIDILAKYKDIPDIKNIFLSNGYRIFQDTPFMHILIFQKTDSPDSPQIEFETKLTRSHPIKNLDYEKDIWRNIQKVKLDDTIFPVLSYENELLYLCLHIFHHLTGIVRCYFIPIKFKWFCDINDFINKFRDKIDWELFVRQCKRCKVDTAVYYVLFNCKTYLDANIPENVYIKLRPSPLRRFFINRVTIDPLLNFEKDWCFVTYYYKNALLYFSIVPIYMIFTRFKWIIKFNLNLILKITNGRTSDRFFDKKSRTSL